MVSDLLRYAVLPIVVLGTMIPAAAWGAPKTAPASYDLEEYDADALEEAVSRGKDYKLTYFGETHALRLKRTNLRSSRFRMLTGSLDSQHLSFSGPPRTYAGEVVGEPGSLVRVSTSERGLRGYIRTAEGWTFIEPAEADQARVARAHRVFTENDLDDSFLGDCASPLVLDPNDEHALPPHPIGAQIGTESPTPPSAEAGALRVLELAIDADVEFFQSYGAGALAEIESVINVVDGIFQSELDLTVEIVSVNIYQSEPDPYTSTDSGTLLQELRNYWNGNNQTVARDAVHLFSGKELDGSTVGIAYVGVVCSTTVSYALSQDIASDALMPILVAHEIGHNLNADHDPSSDNPRYIMYPSLGVTNLDEFSSTSDTTIANYVGAVSCLALADDSGGDGSGGGSESDTGGSGGGGGGGGGGGPVDPLLVAVLALALAGGRRKTGQHARGARASR